MRALLDMFVIWLVLNVTFVALMANRARYRGGISTHSTYREG